MFLKTVITFANFCFSVTEAVLSKMLHAMVNSSFISLLNNFHTWAILSRQLCHFVDLFYNWGFLCQHFILRDTFCHCKKKILSQKPPMFFLCEWKYKPIDLFDFCATPLLSLNASFASASSFGPKLPGRLSHLVYIWEKKKKS